jgi:hypothetical protein
MPNPESRGPNKASVAGGYAADGCEARADILPGSGDGQLHQVCEHIPKDKPATVNQRDG